MYAANHMLTYSRAHDIRTDEGTMFAVTESIVKLGRVSIDQGNYLQYLHQAAFGLIDVVLLLNPLASALAAAVLMLAALELGASRKCALAVALIYAFCTTAWVYARN